MGIGEMKAQTEISASDALLPSHRESEGEMKRLLVWPHGFPAGLRICAFLHNALFVTGSRVTATWSSQTAITIVWMRTSRGETTT